jgi:hypothetical protein
MGRYHARKKKIDDDQKTNYDVTLNFNNNLNGLALGADTGMVEAPSRGLF